MTLATRRARSDDRPFIVSGWSSSLRMTRDVPLVPMAQWAAVYHPIIESILDRRHVETLVVEGSVLAGFICFEQPDYVFYCYVAQPFRRGGLASQLFYEAGIDPASCFRYACRTLASWHLRSKIPLAQYDPFHARYTPEENEQHDRDRSSSRKAAR